MATAIKLYEIFVPIRWNNGCKIDVSFHQQWDRRVVAITGGLTLMPQIAGKWLSDNREDMLPVRIACSPDKIRKVAKLTKDFYIQESIIYYVISDEVYII